MPDDDAHIHLRLDPEDKREWTQYVDEHVDYASLAHLIRVAVWNEINQDPIDIDLDPIHDRIDDIDDRLDDMGAAVDRIDLAAENSRQIQSLAEDILPHLPQRGTASDDGDWLGTPPEDDADIEDIVADYGRLADITQLIGEERYTVRRACDKLSHDLDWVKTAIDSTNEPRYWRTDA